MAPRAPSPSTCGVGSQEAGAALVCSQSHLQGRERGSANCIVILLKTSRLDKQMSGPGLGTGKGVLRDRWPVTFLSTPDVTSAGEGGRGWGGRSACPPRRRDFGSRLRPGCCRSSRLRGQHRRSHPPSPAEEDHAGGPCRRRESQRDAAREDTGSPLGTARAAWKRMWWRGKAHLGRAQHNYL